jgi:hypothetical protein
LVVALIFQWGAWTPLRYKFFANPANQAKQRSKDGYDDYNGNHKPYDIRNGGKREHICQWLTRTTQCYYKKHRRHEQVTAYYPLRGFIQGIFLIISEVFTATLHGLFKQKPEATK